MAKQQVGVDVELQTSLAAVRARLPILVFAGCMLLAAVVSRQLTIARESAETAQVESASHAMLEEMQLRLNAYEVMLRSTASFISNRPEFDRDAFEGFITSQSIRDSFPGVLAIGYAVWGGPATTPTAKIRYVEPAQPENARVMGFDLMSEPARREAIEACIRTGDPVATSPVTLSQDQGSPRTGPGVVLLAPVRSEPLDHNSPVRGIAFLSFRTRDFFRAILATTPPITFSVTDGATLLGGAAPRSDKSENVRTTERPVLCAGRTWTFRGWSNVGSWPGFPTGYAIYGIGLLVATFLSVTVSREIRGREAAERMAERVRESERAAAGAEERYRLFVAQSSEAIWRFECSKPLDVKMPPSEQAAALLSDAKIEECNSAFALMCGAELPDELVGRSIAEVFGDGSWLPKFLAGFVERGYRVVGFESEDHVDGAPRFHLHSLVGVLENGFLRRGWGVVRSVTTERLAQREILQLNLELEDRVNARTSELHEANQEMEAFTYTVSHDLRSPLRTMAGFGRILREDYGDRLDEEGRTLLGRIESAAVRLSQLIDALLGYSRLSRVAMEVRELDFSETASRIAEEIREAKAESVDVWVEPGLSIRADPELLEILLANLLSNAFKFTSRTANPRIEVGKVGDEFFVRDNGAGFDPAFTQRLFRAFERLHNEREFPGTGIGLASVERIVARHRGSVRAESAPGEGATFYFRLEGGTQGEGSGAVA